MLMSKQKGFGLTEFIVAIVIWWLAFYVLFDIQLSVRAEQADTSDDIFDAMGDSISKTFTITDYDSLEDMSINNDIDNEE